MTLDLDQLKQEILEQLVVEEFAIFRGQPGGLDNTEAVYWDTEEYPDYQGFLNAAKNCGARVIIFTHRVFDQEEMDDALEQLQSSTLSRDERREVESGLRELRPHLGSVCSIEMAFDHGGRLYIYELISNWFESYITLSDLLDTASPVDEDDENPLGGYFSKN